jgi:hypothetical protein
VEKDPFVHVTACLQLGSLYRNPDIYIKIRELLEYSIKRIVIAATQSAERIYIEKMMWPLLLMPI